MSTLEKCARNARHETDRWRAGLQHEQAIPKQELADVTDAMFGLSFTRALAANLDEEAVEAAARAMCELHHSEVCVGVPLEEYWEQCRDTFSLDARAAIAAYLNKIAETP